jgi:hypothetical protein
MVWWGFIVGSRFEGYFHSFYEHLVLHNIEKDLRIIKKSYPLLVQIIFLGKFNPLGNERYRKVSMLLFVDLLKPSVLFVGGWNFEPFPLETLNHIIFPLKDSSLPWPCPLFARSWYGLVFPCHFMVEGQVLHIEQIMLSFMDVLLNTLQF